METNDSLQIKFFLRDLSMGTVLTNDKLAKCNW